MSRPTVTELVEGLEGLNTTQEIETYIRESLIVEGQAFNKDHCTGYKRAIETIDVSMIPEHLLYQLSTDKKGLMTVHYAHKVVSDLQKDLTENKTKVTALDRAEKNIKASQFPIDALAFVQTAEDGLTSSDWRVKLFSVCLLTGRRLGAVAYEASFEAISPSVMKVTSGQKQRGGINTILIPVLADSEAIYEAIQELRIQARETHQTTYQRWEADPTGSNDSRLSNSISGSPKYKAAYDRTFRPLFSGNPEDYLHALRAVYGSIIAKCHQAVTGSTEPTDFVEHVLDHDSVGTTHKYLDSHPLTNIDQVLEDLSDDFVKAMKPGSLKMKTPTLISFDFDAFINAIGNEDAKTEAALMFENPESFAANLGSTFNRLFSIAQHAKPSEDSASAQIESIIRAIFDYNISQEGSSKTAYVYITIPVINKVGQLVYGKSFDTGTVTKIRGGMQKGKKIVGSMEAEIDGHHQKMGIQDNNNLFYRRTDKLDEIVKEIAAQHG
ncbi:MAG: telomere resolvase [Drouetiella hepatica Uher 2000/2452]|uniref:Telomere resolvase n=1 Tax=Drouetiella hepatica Uher 2000/2452 TaxID=904376 RepID=A0A951UR05_9CYAN|nr:telomere resolvase [Drouetiella hepatica Uher 2000/2452]